MVQVILIDDVCLVKFILIITSEKLYFSLVYRKISDFQLLFDHCSKQYMKLELYVVYRYVISLPQNFIVILQILSSEGLSNTTVVVSDFFFWTKKFKI